jgi:hypothetical protein
LSDAVSARGLDHLGELAAEIAEEPAQRRRPARGIGAVRLTTERRFARA